MPRLFALSAMGLILVSMIMSPSQSASAQELGDKKGAAWADLFVSLRMYSVRYENPVVGKGEKQQAYQQKAIYTWTGGRFEVLHITLARDVAFKEKYSAEIIRKEKNPPKELEINKKKAWHWIAREAPPRHVTNVLIVLLDMDKAIIIEQFGTGANVEEVAKRFDFAKVEKALANLPPK